MLGETRKLAILEKVALVDSTKATEVATEVAKVKLTPDSDQNIVVERNPIWRLIQSVLKIGKKPESKPAQEKVANTTLPVPTPTPLSIPQHGAGMPNAARPRLAKIPRVAKAKPKPRKPAVVKNQGHIPFTA